MTRMRSGVRLPLRPPILSRDFFPERTLSERPKAPGVRATCAIENDVARPGTLCQVCDGPVAVPDRTASMRVAASAIGRTLCR